MNGSSMTGRCSFVLFSVIPFLRALDGALATLVPTGLRCPRQRQELRAPALPSRATARDSGLGTRRPCMTPLTSSLQEAGTTALGSAFGSREHINARAWESVRACDEMRSAIGSVDHAPTEIVSSPGSALMSPSSCITHASTGTCWTRTCWSLRSMGTCRTTPGGKPLRPSLAADLASARRWASRSLLPVASCALPLCPPWSTTFSHAFGVPNQLIMAEYDARSDAALHASSRRFRPTRLSFFWDS